MRLMRPSIAAIGFIVLFVRLASAQTTGTIAGHALTATAQRLASNTSVVLYDAAGGGSHRRLQDLTGVTSLLACRSAPTSRAR
jgi:hypothetical protein